MFFNNSETKAIESERGEGEGGGGGVPKLKRRTNIKGICGFCLVWAEAGTGAGDQAGHINNNKYGCVCPSLSI